MSRAMRTTPARLSASSDEYLAEARKVAWRGPARSSCATPSTTNSGSPRNSPSTSCAISRAVRAISRSRLWTRHARRLLRWSNLLGRCWWCRRGRTRLRRAKSLEPCQNFICNVERLVGRNQSTSLGTDVEDHRVSTLHANFVQHLRYLIHQRTGKVSLALLHLVVESRSTLRKIILCGANRRSAGLATRTVQPRRVLVVRRDHGLERVIHLLDLNSCGGHLLVVRRLCRSPPGRLSENLRRVDVGELDRRRLRECCWSHRECSYRKHRGVHPFAH